MRSDGYKLLFTDGIFCEFAVFEEAELPAVSFAAGRIVWKAEGVAETLATPVKKNAPPEVRPVEWMVGEALTCLYVGLCRQQRGEKLSAMRFIQHYAVDRIIELSAHLETAQPALSDPFSAERRYEQRFPTLAQTLPEFMQGYERNSASAQAMLEFLDARFDVNPALKHAILAIL